MSGVQSVTVTADETDLRLDRWFSRRFPDLGHGRLEKLLRTGQVRVDGKRAKSNQRLEAGQLIRVPPLGEAKEPAEPKAPKPVSAAEAKALTDAVLYIDDDVIVLNKPAGLAVQGGTSLDHHHLDAMLDALVFKAKERPRLVHRLDKDTSGALLLGRNAFATAKLAASFRSREARKCYWALVVGVPRYPQGRIDAALAKMTGKMGDKVEVDEEDGKRAVTYYRVVDSAYKKAAWLEMEPRTGRTHQLRAHCGLLGTPIQGDGKYGGTEAYLTGQGVSKKLHLHSRAVMVPHPRKGLIKVEAPLPAHMSASFDFFGFDEARAGAPFVSFEED
ncbi:MAG TPA: RluA family pseudouridine synthase [Magnetospirillaceae bacterium]|nr:RluA family pseudouridine synthase [Magnetospirillaceae bacterium]